MKIATWNIERLKHKKALAEIMSSIDEIKADILVLTETDQRLYPIIKALWCPFDEMNEE